MNNDGDLEGGEFSSWMTQIRAAIRNEGVSDVPCGGCTACCTSSQFVHIGPDEADTLAHIPAELLFRAPRLPPGHVLLGYDERGHCPMLIDDRCSIYEHRPRTCRTYDCRIFPAAGLGIAEEDMVRIAQRTQRWRFAFPTEEDRVEHQAVQAAATFIDDHPGLLPEGVAPTNTTQLAVLALEIHDIFLRRDQTTDRLVVADPEPDVVRAETARRIGELGIAPGGLGELIEPLM